MRTISFIAVCSILAASVAVAAEKSSTKPITLTPEVARIVLQKNASDVYDDTLGYGGTISYQLKPYLWAELPIMMSWYEGKDLPPGQDAELMLASVTPGLALGSTGRLRYWMFMGFGATIVSGEITEYDKSAETNEIGFTTNFRTGVDFYIIKNLLAGAVAGVVNTSVETEQLGGDTEWETIGYYTLGLRLGYTF